MGEDKSVLSLSDNTDKTCYHLLSESGDEESMKVMLGVDDIYKLEVYRDYSEAAECKKVLLLECGRKYILKAVGEKKLAEVVELINMLFDDSILDSLIAVIVDARSEDGKTLLQVSIEKEDVKVVVYC